jgi:hypothetical protein
MAWLVVLVAIIAIFCLVVLRGAPYVPSLRANVRQALKELYQIGQGDLLVDIGSGGGVVLRETVKLGARAIGYEINPILVIISRLLSWHEKSIKVKLADYWLVNLPSDTTVVYTFLVDKDMPKLEKWMQKQSNRLQKPLYLISHGFDIKDREAINSVGAYYLYDFKPLQPDKPQV